jgi:anti-sigma factor RsiW
MQCDRDRTLLEQYLDGELAQASSMEYQEHIGVCPSCAAAISELVTLKRSLRAARGHFAPSIEFRRKIQQQISTSSKPSWWQSRLRWSFAGALAALVVLFSILSLEHFRRADSLGEIADLHVIALASANPVDVVSTDRHTVKPWFQGKIPFSFNIPESTGTEFSLIGGRLVYLHQQPGAQLIFAVRQHKISVLIFQQGAANSRIVPVGEIHGRHNFFNVEAWSAQGLQFAVIGDADPGEIRKLAQLMKAVNG